jgi:hypothetical protein
MQILKIHPVKLFKVKENKITKFTSVVDQLDSDSTKCAIEASYELRAGGVRASWV